MSDTNRARMSYSLESTWGTSPTGSYKDIRYTSEGLKQTTEQRVSDEVRFDRQDADVFRSSVGAAGPINFELSGETFDDMFTAILGNSTWSTPVVSTATDIAATGTNTFTTVAEDWVADGFVANQWVYVSGFTNAANNGFFKIISVATTVLTVAGLTATTVEAAGASITINMGAQLINSTELVSMSWERNALDIAAGAYMLYPAMSVESAQVRIATGEAITGNLAFLGLHEAFNTSSVGSGYTLAATNPVMEAIDHVAGILEGGVAAGVQPITELEMNIATGLRNRMQVANVGPISQGLGSFTVSGSLRQYFSDNVLFAKYLANTPTSIAVVFNDTATPYRYVFDMPQVKFSDGERVSGGKNQDIVSSLPYMAYMHPTELITMRLVRWSV